MLKIFFLIFFGDYFSEEDRQIFLQPLAKTTHTPHARPAHGSVHNGCGSTGGAAPAVSTARPCAAKAFVYIRELRKKRLFCGSVYRHSNPVRILVFTSSFFSRYICSTRSVDQQPFCVCPLDLLGAPIVRSGANVPVVRIG